MAQTSHPAAQHAASRDTAAKLENLLTSLLANACVPFLGAGMSYAADPGRHRLRTDQVCLRLANRLRHLSNERARVPAHLMAQVDGMSLSGLAELLWHYYGLPEAVDALGLEEWGEVAPTLAHRYLALLVRERLVVEAITTNYDCLLEEALKATRPPALPSRDWPQVTCRPIRSLEEYRKYGALRPSQSRVLLLLVKANGCAER